MAETTIEKLKGVLIYSIKLERSDPSSADDIILFSTNCGFFKMYHNQDCSEQVQIEDISGELIDIVGSEVLDAYSATEIKEGENNAGGSSSTWTFYNIATIRGSVNIRWLGESNGYYSEKVNFKKITKEEYLEIFNGKEKTNLNASKKNVEIFCVSSCGVA